MKTTNIGLAKSWLSAISGQKKRKEKKKQFREIYAPVIYL